MTGIVAAAGAGRRFGGSTPKQLLEVGGRPILDWTVERLLAVCEQVVVAVPPLLHGALEEHFATRERVVCIAGGATRWRSVRRAFAVTRGAETDLIAVHDGARPAVARQDLEAVIAAARVSSAAILGRPAHDTLKRARSGRIVETVDRREIFHAETPQVFTRAVFERAIGLARAESLEPTDESGLVERLDGVSVALVTAEHPNPKLTRPGDLALIESLLAPAAGGAS